LLVSVGDLQAQDSSSIQSGARVRVSAPGEAYRGLIGTVSGYGGGNIGIKPDNEQSSVWVPLASVTRLQQSKGLKPNRKKGALIGLFVGGALGAAIGAASYKECVSEHWMGFDCMFAPVSAGVSAALGGFVLGTIGAGIGALAGASVKTDRWEEVPLDRVRVSLAPQRDGRLTVGVRLAF